MDKLIDAKGLACPGPVIEARKALRGMTAGKLEIIVDNEIARQNLEKMAGQAGLAYTTNVISAGEIRIKIAVGEPAEISARAGRAERLKQGTVVIIASDLMGTGEEDLGRILMNGFLFALTELEKYPEKVLLYNSGVKLSTVDSEALQDLTKLSEAGVEILSCGTCLDYYKLTEKLQVGTVTNMYEIAESIFNAKQIIQP